MEHDSQEIRLCALVLSVVAFFLFIAAEIVHEEQSAPSRGVLLFVAIGALAFAWIGPLALLAGTLRSKKFQWWQPFRGGAEFVWMQAFGWCFHTFVVTGSVVVLANPQVPKWFQGQYLLLGAVGFMAQILLNLSIGCFREVADTDQPAFQFPLTTKAVVSLLVSASGSLMFICYDLFSHLGQSPVMVVLGCIEFIVSALVIHVLYGCADIPGFRIWQPFEGERTFLLLQYLGWQLFAFTIGGAMNVFFKADDESGYQSSKGTGTAIGAMGMTSQVLLLVSLQYFDGSSIKNESSLYGDDQESNEKLSVKSQERAKKGKRPAEVYVASLLCIGALGVGCLSYASRAKIVVLPERMMQFFLAHEKVGWVISLSSLAIASPISNMGGVRSKPEYQWWQPFQGGTKFVFLQTIGWLWYGFYLALTIILCMNSSKFGDVAACLVLVVGTGSAGAISMSLFYFQSSEKLKTGDGKAAQYSYWYDAIKGEVTMVMLLSLSSTLFHFLIDYFQEEMLPSIRAFCLVLAMALFVLASAVSHLSGRKLHSQFQPWQPFEGGDRYVIRQAVGWALFGVQLLFDSLLLTLVTQNVPYGVLSLLGIFAVGPQTLILSSIQYFQPSMLSNQGSQAVLNPRGSAQTRNWRVLMQDTTLRWHTGSNLLVVVGSLCLFIGAEILGSRGSSFQRAEKVLYLFGCLLSSYGIGFTHCILGPKVHTTYRVFQPFRGGIQFITIHGSAWTVVSVAWALSMTAMYWSSMFFKIPGIHLLTGLLYIVPQSLLLYSIPLFRPTEERSDRGRIQGKDTGTKNEQNLKAEDLANQFFVGRLLGFSGCAVFVLVDLAMLRWGPSIPVFPMTVSAVLALFSSIPLSYKFASSNYGTKAKTIGGGIVFVVLGCALWSFTLLLGGLFSYHLWGNQDASLSVTSVNAPTKYLGTFTGSVGFTAQLLFFQASEPPHLKSELGIKLPLEEKLFMMVSTLKKHLAFAPIWVYSSVPLVAGLLYAHTKSVLPKHLATNQILVILLCSAAVIWSAWWIQQQIVSTGCVYLPRDGGARKLSATATSSVTEALTQSIPILDIGLDCYVQIAAFLTISELVVCSSASRGLGLLHSEGFWRQIFLERFSRSSGAQPANDCRHSSIIPSLLPQSIVIGAKPFAATTLNRVETTAVNLICRLKFIPSYCALKRAGAVSMRNKWKAFCLGGERHITFEQCKLCKQVDAVSSSLKRWEQGENCTTRTPSTWVTLCECVNPVTLRCEKAHRACLEKKLRDAHHNTAQSTANTAVGTPFAWEGCSVCDIGLTQGDRLPKSMRELLQVTWEDFWRSGEDFGGGFFVFVPASASLFIFALKKVGWGSWAMYLWVIIIVGLCFIINSPRFDRSLARLGGTETPSFMAYQRAYHALALSSIMSLAWCCPSMNQAESATFPSFTQTAVKVAFRGNCAFFFALSAAAFLAFWRTQYRVATVNGLASARLAESTSWSNASQEREDSSPTDATATQETSCVLCLLKLCDDGTE